MGLQCSIRLSHVSAQVPRFAIALYRHSCQATSPWHVMDELQSYTLLAFNGSINLTLETAQLTLESVWWVRLVAGALLLQSLVHSELDETLGVVAIQPLKKHLKHTHTHTYQKDWHDQLNASQATAHIHAYTWTCVRVCVGMRV